MSQQYKWLENKINLYLDRISTPAPQLNGWAPCPFVSSYRNTIQISVVPQGIKEPILQAFQMLEPLKLKAIVLAFPKKPPFKRLEAVTDELINLPEYEHIECLLVNHRLKGLYRGVDTRFEYCDLVIIQNSSQLYWARQNLKKRGYYTAKNSA